MKVSIGVLSAQKLNNDSSPGSQMSCSPKPKSPQENAGAVLQRDYSHAAKTYSTPADASIFSTNVNDEGYEATYDGYFDAVDQLPISSTWDFDFSLDPFFSCSSALVDSPELTFGTDQIQDVAAMASASSIQGVSTMQEHGVSGKRPTTRTENVEPAPMRRKRAKITPKVGQSSAIVPYDGENDEEGDEFFFRHYEQCIGGWSYSLKDDGKGNYLRFVLDYIRSPRCNLDSPFRLSVLAWTAKHWALTYNPDSVAWRSYYDRAIAAIQVIQDNKFWSAVLSTDSTERSALSSPADVVICSTLFLCRCDVLNDDLDSILQLLNNLKQHLNAILSGSNLSAFGSQILLWLGYLHVRVSIFSSNNLIPDTSNDGGKVATTLLDAISDHPDYQTICDRSHLYLSEIFGQSYPTEELLQDVEKAPVSVRTHETFCLIANILRYRSWKRTSENKASSHEHVELDKAKVVAIDLDIRRIDAEFGLAMATNPSAGVLQRPTQPPTQALRHQDLLTSNQAPDILGMQGLRDPSTGSTASGSHLSQACSPGSIGMNVTPGVSIPDSSSTSRPMHRASLQWLACYAVFLTAKILWSRVLHPTVRSEDSAKAAAKEIIHIALQLRKTLQYPGATTSWSRKIPRSMLWPLPLFMAGIETTDEVHADWILGFMNEVTSAWGGEVVRDRKDGSGHANEHSGSLNKVNSAKRVQVLMERVRQAQDYVGCRVDVESVMMSMVLERGSLIL